MKQYMTIKHWIVTLFIACVLLMVCVAPSLLDVPKQLMRQRENVLGDSSCGVILARIISSLASSSLSSVIIRLLMRVITDL